MASKSDTVKDKSTSSKEPVLKFNLEEFREMRELESAGNIIGVQDLKKRVRQRMEEELASSGLANSLDGKKAKQVKSTTATSTSIVDGGNNFLVKNAKDTVVNQKRLETIVSTSSKKNNILNNEDKKVVVKKEKSLTTNILKSTGESLTVNKVKHGVNKEKPKSSASAPKFTRGNGNLTSNKGKQASVIHQERLTSLTPISKSTSVNLSNNNNKGKAKQTTTSKDFDCDLSINNDKRSIVNKESKELVKCVERWKLLREKGGIYRPLESFLPTEILNDKVQMVTVDKIAKEFELKRLRRLLNQDKERQNGNKKLAQERIDHLNNFGKDYTRLEIAAVRNDKGPKKEQQIRAFIAFLNEKNIIKNKKVTKLDIIEDPNYLKRGFEQFKEERLIKQNKEKIVQKDLGKKRKLERISEFNLQFRDKSEQGKHNQQKSKVERKSEGKLLDQRDQRRNQERIAETKKLQEEVQRRRNRVAEESHPKHSNAQKKVIANRNEVSTLKKRKFDDRSEPASSQAQKRRNVEHNEIDFCRLDEETVNRNLSSIIHSLVRPGRRPIYGIVDDNDDDAMEVSGFEVFREEARSSRIARKEDDEEERAEQLRRMKRLKIKKAQDKR